MRDRFILTIYLLAVIGITLIHSPLLLAALLAAALLTAGKRAPGLAKRALVAIVLFNLVVTVTYTTATLIQASFEPRFLLLINLRVFLLTFLTFYLAGAINPFRALAFSRSLSFLLILAYSQIITFRRLLQEFTLAFRSRMIKRPTLGELYHRAAATASFFIAKSLRNSTEITQAMTSRGFFDARD